MIWDVLAGRKEDAVEPGERLIQASLANIKPSGNAGVTSRWAFIAVALRRNAATSDTACLGPEPRIRSLPCS